MIPTPPERTPVVIRVMKGVVPFEEQRDEMLRRLFGDNLRIHKFDAQNIFRDAIIGRLQQEFNEQYTDTTRVVAFELASTDELQVLILAYARRIPHLTVPVLFPVFQTDEGAVSTNLPPPLMVIPQPRAVRFLSFLNLTGITANGEDKLDGHSLRY